MAASEMISTERGGKWPPLSSVRPPLCPPGLQLPFPLNGLLVRDANVFWADVARAKPPFIPGGWGGGFLQPGLTNPLLASATQGASPADASGAPALK